MIKINYRVKKLENHWHLQKREREGWWIFKCNKWYTEFPWYSSNRRLIENQLLNHIDKDIIKQLTYE